jgi:2-dehydro-3-deoxyphosphogluconate aldolase/(4S)-4-hydroxy-2-oxoglutarate aldolase
LCPWTRITPTGVRAVSKPALAEWFKAGIVAAGIGRELLKKESVEQRDYASITRRAAEICQWIQEARGR